MCKKILREKFNCEFPNTFFNLLDLAKIIYSKDPLNAFADERYYPGCSIRLIGPYNFLFNEKFDSTSRFFNPQWRMLNIPLSFIPIVEGVMGQEYDLVHCYVINDKKVISISSYDRDGGYIDQNTTDILEIVKNQVKDDYKYYKSYNWNKDIDIGKIEETLQKVLG